MSLSIDDRRFLKRHNPTFASPVAGFGNVNAAIDGVTIALRSDGLVFYSPNAHPDEVWVGWLAKGPSLKSTPATRRVASLEEYNAVLAASVADLAEYLGS